jgi:L-methionine (R)-S-oxide reductase
MNIPPNSILGAIRLCQVSNVMFLRGISSVYVEGNLDSLAGLTRSGPGLQGFRDTSTRLRRECKPTVSDATPVSKTVFYRSLVAQLEALIGTESDWLANLANAAALLYNELPDINWAGFYLLKEGELVLGPFQGQPACVRIALGKGVCGTAAERRTVLVVPDVHRFPGHIACDPRSRSEVVVPWIADERLIGVLDIDSPKLARFGAQDAAGLQVVVELLTRYALPGTW